MKECICTILPGSNLPSHCYSIFAYSPSSLKKIPSRMAQGSGSGTAIHLSGTAGVNHCHLELENLSGSGHGEIRPASPVQTSQEAVVS